MVHTVGVDIGGTKIAAGVVDEQGALLATTRRETPAKAAADIQAAVADAVAELSAAHPISAVGVAAAGFVDASRSTVVFAPNLAWRDEPLRAGLEQRLGLPVVVENDANAAAWGEYRFGGAVGDDGRLADDVLLLTVGTGLGGGIIAGGRLQRGDNGAAAEVGHARAVPGGHLCGCGNRGCWEQYVSGSALVREARALASAGAPGTTALLAAADGHPEAITGPVVTRLAAEGDPTSLRLLADLGRWLGEAVASFVAILDPEVIVIGGGVSAAGDLLLQPARESYAANLSGRGFREPAPLRLAKLGNDAGIIGAADLARTA
ncbi:glucokinase [Kineococcus xinjiangensis]|uniref:Glucokinase n=1 Tax=Kineococcus xinjiangensis TaxID=512762 RepID=A0A2S6IM21_9ACTN|nr:ROK family glucokinase [Kineococcus xinjiangensis]PPK95284.1 glucokinase [Kineococcus xinjiangensis]